MHHLQPANFFVLRRPLLSIDNYMAVQQQLTQGVPLCDVLHTFYANELCLEALYYASPAVHHDVMAWLEGGKTPSDKLLLTLYKYVIRITTRCTPFGLFAGVSTGKWGTDTLLCAHESVERTIRLDTGLLSQLMSVINTVPLIRNQLRYSTNTSLWVMTDTVRYIGYTEMDGQRTYYQNEAKADDYLLAVIELARQGLSFRQLTERLNQQGVETEAAQTYLESLIDNQIIISELSVNVTGPDPLTSLISRLESLSGAVAITNRLNQLQALLKQQQLAAHRQMDVLVREMLPVSSAPILQCDTLFAHDRHVLATSVRSMLSRDLSVLALHSRTISNPGLDEFKRRFFDRYEDQVIPLLFALDPDAGIGYAGNRETPEPWLDKLPWETSGTQNAPKPPVSETLLRLYIETVRDRRSTLTLTSDDLDAILPKRSINTLPVSSYAIGSLFNSNPSAEPLFVLKGMGGPSAANLLGRFAHLSPELATNLKKCLQNEQDLYADALLAEIVHLPPNRAGNVLCRPTLRAYEIPILTRSFAATLHQFPLDDLLIAVPKGQRVVLYSRKTGQEILPRLSTAHNVHPEGLAHYRFLYDLQHQDTTLRVAWEWGSLQTMPFLPRVQYQHLILCRAQWCLHQREVNDSFDRQWTDWKLANGLPRYVVLAQGDNELLLDTTISAGISILQQALNRDGQIILMEWLEDPSSSATHATEQFRWCHELVVPLHNANLNPVKPSDVGLVASPGSDPSRQFGPGDQWVYLKLYTGATNIDTLLTNELPHLLADLRNRNLSQSWFFVRFADPEKHLRLRFLATEENNWSLFKSVSEWANKLLNHDDRIYRVQFDTYQREIERYGARTIEACEDWFVYDSEAILKLLSIINNEQPDWQRLRIGCLFIYELLNAWQPDFSEQISVVEKWRDAFLLEFGVDKAFRTEMNKLFREFNDWMKTVSIENEPDLTSLLVDYKTKAVQFRKHIQSLSVETFTSLLPHLAHLFINRLFIDSQRKNELMLYYFLHKLLKQWKAQ